MDSGTATRTAGRTGQGRRGRFPIGLLFAAPALLLPGTARGEGNITAYTNHDGDLIVLGDSQSNGVFVGRTGEANEYLVEGLDRGSGPTTVNGLESEILIAVGEHIRIVLNDGDDRLHFDGQHPGSVTVDGGRGNDWIGIGDPVISEYLEIDGGPGDDLVDIQDSLVEGDLFVRTGQGADQIVFFFAALHGNTLLDTGPGVDDLSVDSSIFSGSLFIETGGDADEVTLFDLVIGNELEARLGPGDDLFEITEVSIGGKVRCDGGAGDDTYSDGGGNNFGGGNPQIRRFESILTEPEL